MKDFPVTITIIVLFLFGIVVFAFVGHESHQIKSEVTSPDPTIFVDDDHVTIRRYVDDKYGVVCYTRPGQTISCVKITK